MKLFKALFWITLVAGLTIFSIGVYLNFTNQSSESITTDKFGHVHHGVITGFSGMFVGVIILLLSVWTFWMYKVERKKFKKMK
jgi:uncharacterized membrane protein YiaA